MWVLLVRICKAFAQVYPGGYATLVPGFRSQYADYFYFCLVDLAVSGAKVADFAKSCTKFLNLRCDVNDFWGNFWWARFELRAGIGDCDCLIRHAG